MLRADVIQQLMCQAQIDIARVEKRHDIEFSTYFASEIERLEPLAEDGLIEMHADRISATSRGRLLLRIIAMCFDRYLNEAHTAASKPRFSRVI
jgi:oxygen-independent coproporphyrinogen-3 oxidase